MAPVPASTATSRPPPVRLLFSLGGGKSLAQEPRKPQGRARQPLQAALLSPNPPHSLASLGPLPLSRAVCLLRSLHQGRLAGRRVAGEVTSQSPRSSATMTLGPSLTCQVPSTSAKDHSPRTLCPGPNSATRGPGAEERPRAAAARQEDLGVSRGGRGRAACHRGQRTEPVPPRSCWPGVPLVSAAGSSAPRSGLEGRLLVLRAHCRAAA